MGLICIVGVCSAEGQSASKSGIVAADLGVMHRVIQDLGDTG